MKPRWMLVWALYPFAAGAMALNVYFVSLLLSWIGWAVLSPLNAGALGLVLGLPAAWAYARHLTRLMAEADGEVAS
ncbi:NnrT protein [Rubellimicrobium arenae]|uniref:NnrT protein n=1 Tax=Rubellimicrobium arenae TaxID=2817372 RepID=UPI001B304D52|nr:NnrT protein [Rubellimicrobium arenae]